MASSSVLSSLFVAGGGSKCLVDDSCWPCPFNLDGSSVERDMGRVEKPTTDDSIVSGLKHSHRINLKKACLISGMVIAMHRETGP